MLINIEVGRVEGGFFYTETRNYTITCTEELLFATIQKTQEQMSKELNAWSVINLENRLLYMRKYVNVIIKRNVNSSLVGGMST